MSIKYEKKGNVAYITLNRPEVHNAINIEGRGLLAKIWAEVRDDPEVRIAIVTGAGDKAFSAGADLKEVGAMLTGGGSANMDQLPTPENDPLLLLQVWKPFIAAINGIATGAGLELAMVCDLRIAADTARLGLAETKRAVIPGAGGTQRLPRFVPMCQALEILMTGDFIDAQEAYRIGLVNKVVPAAELMSAAEELAARICENGPVAVQAVKELAHRGVQMPFAEAMQLEADYVQKMFQTEDVIEGMMSFAQKRKATYKGK